MTDVQVAGVAGSLRDGSHTRRGVERTLESAAAAGASTELVDLRNYDLPVFDADARDAGDADRLRTRLRRADSVVLGTPMYHGSYATPLKNAIDYCGFDEFEETTVGLLAVAGGSFPSSALEHLRTVCRALNAWVLPHRVAIPAADDRFENDRLQDEDLASRLDVLGARLVEYANIEPSTACVESTRNVGGDD